MEHEEYKHEKSYSDAPSSGRWMLPAMIVLALVCLVGVGYGVHQASLVSDMTTRQNQSNAEAAQMRGQIDSLNAKLSEMAAAQQQQQQAREQEAAAQQAAKATAAKTGRTGASSKQMKELRAQLTDQQKQLKDTRDALDKTRTDLETSLSATRDDLNGSIARTHEELVALAKRSDRSYFEFDLNKHAGFERSGPVSLALRKADTKHQRFDLNMIVDDAQLTKKSVNLYEPIWLHRTDDPQPVQIVVNKITKDHVHGYVSSPKYRQSELTTISYTPVNQSPNSSAPANGTPKSQQNTTQPAANPAPPPEAPNL